MALKAFFAGVLIFVSGLALSAEAPCLVSYEDYKKSVPHVELSECPGDEISA